MYNGNLINTMSKISTAFRVKLRELHGPTDDSPIASVTCPWSNNSIIKDFSQVLSGSMSAKAFVKIYCDQCVVPSNIKSLLGNGNGHGLYRRSVGPLLNADPECPTMPDILAAPMRATSARTRRLTRAEGRSQNNHEQSTTADMVHGD